MIIGIFCENYADGSFKSQEAQAIVKALKENRDRVIVITTGRAFQIGPHFVTIPYNRFDGFPLFARIRYLKTYRKLKHIRFDMIHVFSFSNVSALGESISHYQDIPLCYSFFHEDYGKRTRNPLVKYISYSAINLSLSAFGYHRAEVITHRKEDYDLLREHGYQQSLFALTDPKTIKDAYLYAKRKKF